MSKVGNNQNSEVNWREDKSQRRAGEEKAWNVLCIKTVERIERKIDSPFKVQGEEITLGKEQRTKGSFDRFKVGSFL